MRKVNSIKETMSNMVHLMQVRRRGLPSSPSASSSLSSPLWMSLLSETSPSPSLVSGTLSSSVSLLSHLTRKQKFCHILNRRNFTGNAFASDGRNNKKEFSNNCNIVFLLALFCTPSLVQGKRNNKNKKNIASCASLEKVYLTKKEEIKDGEMKEIKVRGEKDTVLLVHVNDKYYCLGPKCPHYSAPLRTGILTKEYVTCPWHDAKFDLKTGECINGPSFDDIPKYEVTVEGNDIYAYLPEKVELFEKKKICPCSGKCEKKTILIVGGGAATLGALEEFLKLGYSGKLVICSKDEYKPYDRPTLSKSISMYESGEELFNSIKLKDNSYYERENITYMHNVSVEKVDSENKKAYLSNGDTIQYDQILVASGVRPSESALARGDSGVSGESSMGAENLLTLHNLKDNVKIASYAKEGSRCVIIGSSFIACELSAALKKRNVNITMISKDSLPFYNVFGEKIGSVVLDILKEKNVTFYGNVYPVEYIMDRSGFFKKSKSIHGVRLSNGEVISCDYVVEALGCFPNSEFLDDTFKNEKKQIIVDKHFKVKGSSDIFAAGDVCAFPYFSSTGELVNICHWNVAIQQGRIAAHNMLNNNNNEEGKEKKQEFTFLPFFNTNIFGKNFRYSGYVKDYKKVIFEGDLKKHNFIAYFVKDEKVASILTLGNGKMAALNECLSKGKVPRPYELEAGLKNSDSMISTLS
ncbi:ferrodoxin reductase [Plasmodium gonderi]|uniref:Ferrodoxin reductase n=1 Tax=Plasmodium gonderi TaxID=77519 RepID=A0A1Y1JFY2_PLAGO|nr:ferrodoxin reductase [Plasmodium gonderi]GAW79343.1 ferrodoxin reductase [Plasmodium gonderi]